MPVPAVNVAPLATERLPVNVILELAELFQMPPAFIVKLVNDLVAAAAVVLFNCPALKMVVVPLTVMPAAAVLKFSTPLAPLPTVKVAMAFTGVAVRVTVVPSLMVTIEPAAAPGVVAAATQVVPFQVFQVVVTFQAVEATDLNSPTACDLAEIALNEMNNMRQAYLNVLVKMPPSGVEEKFPI